MGRRKRYLISYAVMCLVLAAAESARAQSYYDVTFDGATIYTDTFDDAPVPQPPCATYTTINVLLGSYGGSSTAYYPGTAHVAVSTPASIGVAYQWSREIIHHGLQRGGNCGVFLDTTVVWPVDPLRKIRAYYRNAGSVLGITTYHRCNPNNACDTLLSKQTDPFVLLTVYQIQIGLGLSCQALPGDKVPQTMCVSPDPIP